MCVLTSVDLLNCEPSVDCAFDSQWQLSLTAIGCFGVSVLLLCHVRAGVVCVGEGLYTASVYEQPHDNNGIILCISR